MRFGVGGIGASAASPPTSSRSTPHRQSAAARARSPAGWYGGDDTAVQWRCNPPAQRGRLLRVLVPGQGRDRRDSAIAL